MTLQQLQYFRTLAKVQHYTKAAEILFVSQPSLSYAISELEKELSLALFERHGKKTQLSAQGKIFLTYVESALDQLEKGVVTIKSLNPLGGAVRLGYIYSLSNSFIREALLSFYSDERNKHITFQFTQNVNSNIVEALNVGAIDLAICPKPTKECMSVEIYRQELYAIVPKDHQLAHKKEIDINELKDESFALVNKKTGLRWAIDELFKEIKMNPSVTYEADECNALINFVSLHFGVSIIPHVPGLEKSSVAVLRIRNPSFIRSIYLAWKNSKRLSPQAAYVKDFFISNFATQNQR